MQDLYHQQVEPGLRLRLPALREGLALDSSGTSSPEEFAWMLYAFARHFTVSKLQGNCPQIVVMMASGPIHTVRSTLPAPALRAEKAEERALAEAQRHSEEREDVRASAAEKLQRK
ncbi:hypothetical protein AK812_SmicGene43070, partial [Symbiodinium microadriaticum]